MVVHRRDIFEYLTTKRIKQLLLASNSVDLCAQVRFYVVNFFLTTLQISK